MVTDIKERLGRCPELPTVPAVAIRILDLCQQSEPDLAEIARLLSRDPALAAKLLQLTNSPAYGLRSKAATVSHATMILGLNAVQTPALSFSLVKNLQQVGRRPATWFWKRSLMSAVAARELAVAVGCPQSEEVFLGALLQDIGILALRQLAEPGYESASAQAGTSHPGLIAAECSLFGVDHAEIGGWLCERWKLPPVLSRAVACSHAPHQLPESTHPDIARIVRIVAVSGLLADVWMRDDAATATAEARATTERLLGLPSATLDQILLRVAENSEEVAGLFQVAVDSQDELTAILERAKEALLMLAIAATRKASDAQETIGQLESKAKTLELEAQRDGLTGLYNRAFFDRAIDERVKLARANGAPISLVIVDIDHFKSVNDTYGHLAGDKILAAVAHLLASQLRSRDISAWYGGEEFALILAEAGTVEAAAVAERVRRSVEKTGHDLGDGTVIHVTVSLGFATWSPQAAVTKESLIAAADAAMYTAKRGGRNRVAAADALGVAADPAL